MNSHGDGKPEPVDPEHLLRMLELEMMQQRAAWKQTHARRKSLRAVSIFFLVVVVLGALFAAYFAYSTGWMGDQQARQRAQASPTPAATHP